MIIFSCRVQLAKPMLPSFFQLFDPHNGLWDLPSLSTHKPKNLDDATLVDATAQRTAISPYSPGKIF